MLLHRYFLARLRYRDPRVVTYLDMGLGIENRARQLALFWAEHLQRTRSAQARWAENIHGKWLTVLGAGRLLDFNRTVLIPRFSEFRLVDADPLCRHVWKKFPKPVDPVCADISGCIYDWVGSLRRIKKGKSWEETLAVIRGKEAPWEAAYTASGNAMLSLNVLSQLLIVWQDEVEAFLNSRFDSPFVDSHEEEWLDALRPAGRMLVEQHLYGLERSQADHVLLITDLEYVEYKGVRYDRDRWAPPPVEWTAESGWGAANEVECTLTPALEGIVLNEEAFANLMPSYRLLWQEGWLWHIAPLGTEEAEVGKVNRVGAFALERKDLNEGA